MGRLRDEAEALAEALELGVGEVAEVIAWADGWILREDRPVEALLDVALAKGHYAQDVARQLRQIPESPEKPEVARLLLILLDHRLKQDAGWAERVASALYGMAIDERIEDPGLCEVAWRAWDCLTEDWQTEEDLEQITKQMANALDRAATDAGTAWSVDILGGRTEV